MAKKKKQQSKNAAAGTEYVWAEGTFRTPRGLSRFAYLKDPDEAFNTVKHKITVIFPDDNDPELRELIDKLRTWSEDHVDVSDETDDVFGWLPPGFKRNDDGQLEVTLSTRPKKDENGNWIPVTVVDAAKRPTSPVVYSGSTVRAAFQWCHWINSTGTGVKAYLAAVQVIERSSGGGAASAFDVEETGDPFDTEDDDVPVLDDAII